MTVAMAVAWLAAVTVAVAVAVTVSGLVFIFGVRISCIDTIRENPTMFCGRVRTRGKGCTRGVQLGTILFASKSGGDRDQEMGDQVFEQRRIAHIKTMLVKKKRKQNSILQINARLLNVVVNLAFTDTDVPLQCPT